MSLKSSELTLDEALVYSLYELEKENLNLTFNDLVVKAFEIFPSLFQLIGYPKYPDSNRVAKSWLRCRTDKKLIMGSPNSHFRLTEAGRILALNVAKKIGATKKVESVQVIDSRSRYGKLITQLRSKPAFRKYIKTKKIPSNRLILSEMLGVTAETNVDKLLEIISELSQAAEMYSDKEVIIFLKKIRSAIFSPRA